MFALVTFLTATALPCASAGAGGTVAAVANAASIETLAWAPFGRAETGWAIYAPKVAVEIGTACAPTEPGFGRALAAWQGAHRLPASGSFDAATFAAMKAKWQAARPFAHIKPGACPPPPPPERLAAADVSEGYGGKQVVLRPAALTAYRAMVNAAISAGLHRHDPRALQLFSGFRDPVSDAARCTAEGNCNGIVRAACSAHRTGLALDLWVGQAAGFGPDSTADVNRRAMVATPVYRWLLTNAARFGFINYVFEPWHWEYAGEPI